MLVTVTLRGNKILHLGYQQQMLTAFDSSISRCLFERTYHRNYGILGVVKFCLGWTKCIENTSLVARLMSQHGPSGAGRTLVGPMLSPWTLLSRSTFKFSENWHQPSCWLLSSGEIVWASMVSSISNCNGQQYIITERWFTTSDIMQYDKVTINPHIYSGANTHKLVISWDQRYTKT